MCRNQAASRVSGAKFVSRGKHSTYQGRVGNAMHGARLKKRSTHCWHGLAAILTVMTVRRARHRIAAPHRLFWRCGITVECICRESDGEYRQKSWLG
jgi:hypothetical protein